MERFDGDLEVQGEELVALGFAAVEPPFVAVGQNAPGKHLGVGQVIADLLVGIALLVLADLGEGVIELLGFEQGNGIAVTLGGGFVNEGFLLGGAGKQDVIRLGVLVGQAQVVGPGEAEPVEDFVEQFLAGEGFVVSGAGKVTLFVKVFAEAPERFGVGIRGPPGALRQTGLEVVIAEQPSGLPQFADRVPGAAQDVSLAFGTTTFYDQRNIADKHGHLYWPLKLGLVGDRILSSGWYPIRVECYAGSKADETPRRFLVGQDWIEVQEALDVWFQFQSQPKWPHTDYFKVLGADGNEYLLKHDLESDTWILAWQRQRG